MFIITKSVGQSNYWLKEINKKGSYKSTVRWEGLIDNATTYKTEEHAQQTIDAFGLSFEDVEIKPI